VATRIALWRLFSKDEPLIRAMTAVERRIRDGHLSLEVPACTASTFRCRMNTLGQRKATWPARFFKKVT